MTIIWILFWQVIPKKTSTIGSVICLITLCVDLDSFKSDYPSRILRTEKKVEVDRGYFLKQWKKVC